jgi:1,4-dihydroxy-2-naphthoate octaprenyltransferase
MQQGILVKFSIMSELSTSQPSYAQRWLLASRPKTLPAAISPVLVGWATAIDQGRFYILAALLIAVLLQIGANPVNDVTDYPRGTDRPE